MIVHVVHTVLACLLPLRPLRPSPPLKFTCNINIMAALRAALPACCPPVHVLVTDVETTILTAKEL